MSSSSDAQQLLAELDGIISIERVAWRHGEMKLLVTIDKQVMARIQASKPALHRVLEKAAGSPTTKEPEVH